MPALLVLALALVLLGRAAQASADEPSSDPAGDVPNVWGGNAVPNLHPAPAYQIDGWINEAIAQLTAAGVDPDLFSADDIQIVIKHESAGDPMAINLTDKNARAGDPSRGLCQVIGATFNHYALPGFDADIWDPVSNICAGVRYAIARYGSTSQIPGVVSVRAGQPYKPY